jgi:hypothetical protein
MTLIDLVGNIGMGLAFAGVYTEACCRLRAIKGAGWCGDGTEDVVKVD